MARPVDPMRRALPFPDWPYLDQKAWQAAIVEGDLFDGRGPAAHWATRTKQTNVQRYGRWLGWLLWSGQLAADALPAERVTPASVRAYHRHLAGLVAPMTVLSLMVGLKVTIAVMVPDRSWRWLQDLCNRVQRRAKPQTDKRSRIRPTGEIYVAALRELEALPSGNLNLHQAVRQPSPHPPCHRQDRYRPRSGSLPRGLKSTWPRLAQHHAGTLPWHGDQGRGPAH